MEKIYDTIIIGAGVGGMTAALYLKRYNVDVLVIEKGYPGGQVTKTTTIENYPGFSQIQGMDLADNIYHQLQEIEVPFEFTEVKSVEDHKTYKLIVTSNKEYKAKTVLIATGRIPKKLGVSKEEDYIGKGISYCAVCDGPLFKGRKVGIVGGGDSALTAALYLADICDHVDVIHRRDQFRASNTLIDRLQKKSNVTILYNSVINTLNGNNDRITSISIKKDNQLIEKNLDGIFVYVGAEPVIEPFKALNLEIVNNYIKTDDMMQTNIDGIYACGDIILKKLYQITTAVGEGALAAQSIYTQLTNTNE